MTTDVLQHPSVSLDPRIFQDAHTTNLFTDEPVDVATVREVYEAVRWAPTAMNCQPLRLALVERGEGRERLVAHLAKGNQDKTLVAPLSIVVAYDPAFHEHFDVLAPHRPGAREKMDGDPEFRDGFARTNALIQLGYLILGLRAAGLAVGPMTGLDAAGVDAELFAESGWRTLAVLNVGHAASEEDGAVRPRAGRLDFETAAVVL
ncbi:malonic semialdehyde reductase [Georgenia sp. 311]|uniref:Malonic semialdehyde reductase n=1 Tax=Georgenia wutianyii TaxID=2585135 RepID=A0ABX5VNW5_9MICO|nr:MULTISPECIES: malonic semialdehyde reductase [Georgenia]QDB80187.1 malonic semialdehyde reductase [Georgenia wutianyii]TNC20656.1 malonic semialdehyde reductase [Georgenia sp. 311]